MKNLPALLALLFTAGLPMAHATMSDVHGLHAVPVPGKVTIDGKLDDWDLSGQVLMCYDLENLRDTYSAKVAVMYDADNLYVSLHFTDHTPLGNIHDPLYQASKAWAGDGIQLRIKTDRISSVTAWYYAPRQEPGLFIDYGKSLTDAFHGGQLQLFRTEGWKMDQGVEQAFRKDDDGNGYVQELKLPWKLITTGKAYRPGDTFTMGVEMFWGQSDWPDHRYADNLAPGASSREFFFRNIPAWGPVTLEPKGSLRLPPPAWEAVLNRKEAQQPVEVPYDLPRDGKVTLAIDDAQGKRVRNLVAAQPRTKGHDVEHWDGLDDNGQPVPPGAYRIVGLVHPGIGVRYALSFNSPGNPSWGTPDSRGAFYGDHTPAIAAAAGGGYVALGCPIGEQGPPLIVCDLAGQKVWGQGARIFLKGGRMSLATDGTTLWISQDQTGTIYRVALATGKYLPWKRLAKDANGRDYAVLDLQVIDAAPAATPMDDSTEHPNLAAIAVHGDLLALCLAKDGVVRFLDKDTGDVKRETKVPSPVGAAFAPDGALVVLSDGHLVRIGTDGAAAPLGSATVADGFGVAVDPQGTIYVTARGADQNVKVFSPQGEPLREIGKRGGRPPEGAYDPAGMLQPGQPAVDRLGHLWVPEYAFNPKRTSVWNTADGALVKDLAGTGYYSGAGGLDPFDPTIGYSGDTVFRLDWATGASRPLFSLGVATAPDDLFPPHVFQLTNRVVSAQGRTYVYTSGSGAGAGVVACAMFADGNWRSVAEVGIVDKGAVKRLPFEADPLFAAHDKQLFCWTDRNGDGKVQPDEVVFTVPAWQGRPLVPVPYYNGQLPGPDGTIVFACPAASALLKLPVTGYGPGGEPLYDVEHPQVVPVDAPLRPSEGMVFGGGEGRTYVNQDPLTAFDKAGRALFTYPSRNVGVHGSHSALSSRPGYLVGPMSFLGAVDSGGEAGEVFDLNGNLGEHYLFTWDGLFVQALFQDTRGSFDTPLQAVRGMAMDTITANGESFGGNLVRLPDGKVCLTIGGTDARVLEVGGLDGIRRFGGTFAYSGAQYAAAQEFDRQAAVAAAVPATFPVPRAAAPPPVDGKGDAWPELFSADGAGALPIQDDPANPFGRAALRYDDRCLYAAWLVPGKPAPRNAGQDTRLLFKTGDCVDLMLGTPGGGVRLLCSVVGGKPVAVLYEKHVPGTADPDRVPFSSPWRTIYFDRVTQPAGVQVATGPAPGGKGFLVEAAIPWTVLGTKPAPGLALRGDVGILNADNGGAATVGRHYWSNKSTNLVNDVPGEADLAPALWGTLVLQ